MTRVGLALALVLGGCPREDASVAATTSATPTPPATQSGTTATPTPPTPPGETTATPTPMAPSDADAVRIVEIDPQAGTLQEQLIAAAARAHADGRPIALELWAGWCAPCKKLDAMLRDGAVADALRGAVLVRADVDAFDEELNALGFVAPQIPSLYRLDERGRARGKPLQGGDWGRRDASAIAAAIAKLLAG